MLLISIAVKCVYHQYYVCNVGLHPPMFFHQQLVEDSLKLAKIVSSNFFF